MDKEKRLSANERKQEIMFAAIKIISEKGFEHTTMEEIISKTSLSKGGVYHYYKNTVEIFRDIMIAGIDYRNQVIKQHLNNCKKGQEVQFIAKEVVNKILDDNPYMPLYIEFLIAKKRNPELEAVFKQLQHQTLEGFKTMIGNLPETFLQNSYFDMFTHFLNGMILASNILEARENFKQNREILEAILIVLLNYGKVDKNESL